MSVAEKKVTIRRGGSKRIIGKATVVYRVKSISAHRIKKPLLCGALDFAANP